MGKFEPLRRITPLHALQSGWGHHSEKNSGRSNGISPSRVTKTQGMPIDITGKRLSGATRAPRRSIDYITSYKVPPFVSNGLIHGLT